MGKKEQTKEGDEDNVEQNYMQFSMIYHLFDIKIPKKFHVCHWDMKSELNN